MTQPTSAEPDPDRAPQPDGPVPDAPSDPDDDRGIHPTEPMNPA